MIQADRPWEKITYFALGTHTVVRDRDGQWHCWYGIHWDFYETPPCFGTWGPYLQDEFTLGYDPLGRMYTATVSEERTQKQVVRSLVDRAFAGSAAKLVMRALSAEKISEEELARIRKMIDEMGREDR